MVGRESFRANNLFYTCSLIDYIGRKTNNQRSDVVDALGRDRIAKIIELADVYHSDNIDAVSDSFIAAAGLADGTFDNVSAAKYAVPSHWDIGKVYKRLIMSIAENQAVSDVEALFRAYHSPVSPLIDDYNGSFFYESPSAILHAYLTGEWD
ncbi:hypothetical protein [Adlercreutzia caecimuris]|uniref:hypothetical protein n=1 Tax=Adlercreutzia caecimuris TaxID=671266 RepID=UPI00272C0249|nr:hypothetical protein [Adlercreutzia caecimuris]